MKRGFSRSDSFSITSSIPAMLYKRHLHSSCSSDEAQINRSDPRNQSVTQHIPQVPHALNRLTIVASNIQTSGTEQARCRPAWLYLRVLHIPYHLYFIKLFFSLLWHLTSSLTIALRLNPLANFNTFNLKSTWYL